MLKPISQLLAYGVGFNVHGLIMLELWFSLYYVLMRYGLIILCYDDFGEILRKVVKGLDEG